MPTSHGHSASAVSTFGSRAAPGEHAGAQSQVRVAMTPSGNGSELQIHHAKLLRDAAPARHAGGWRSAIDQREALLAGEESRHGA